MKRIVLLLVAAVTLCGCQNKSLTIMSLNVRYNGVWEDDGENAWQYRRDAMAAMILEEMPDAVGMQEVLPDQKAWLDSTLGLHYRSIGVGRDDGDTLGESMCIYYNYNRLELIGWKTYWLSETPDSVSFGWDAACRRTVTVATFEDAYTGKHFTYLNTHLDHVGREARKSSVLQLCSIVEQCDGAVVLGGDMNSGIDDSIFLPLRYRGLLSARDIAPVSDTAYTFSGFGKSNPSRIDHFFVRGWKVESFKTLNGDYGVPYVSDHYAIEMKLRIEK
jgi:endonuclease/exonuclease/phosphatase family metal-dependent hydrolase